MDVEGGSTLTVTSDATNYGELLTNFSGGGGGNTIAIGGMLTNYGDLLLNGPGDKASVGNGALNQGKIDVNNASILTINGDADNFGTMRTNGIGLGGGNTLSITSALFNEANATFSLNGPGDSGSVGLGIVNAGTVGIAQGSKLGTGTLTNTSTGFVDVEGGSTLTITSDVINNAGGPQGIYTSFNGTGGNTINIGGNLMNNGMFGLESTGDKANVTGSVTNNIGALFALTGGSSATFSSTLMNSGTVDLENASSLTVNGAASNYGTLSTSGFGGTGGNTMTFTSLLTNQNLAHITINGPGDVLHANGGLANNGFVTVANGSTVDPPFLNNIGIVSIDGTSKFVVGTGTTSGQGYIQLANGTLGEMISNSNFGQVFVSGSASLDGTLDIMLQGGFNPAVGTSYDIILFSPNGLTGVFATVQNIFFNNNTEKWAVIYNDAGGYVQLLAQSNTSPVPEPASLALLGSGLLTAAFAYRGKRSR